MNLQVDFERLLAANKTVRAELLAERNLEGHWVGELSSSPLATATAISALVIAHHPDNSETLRRNADSSVDNFIQSDLSELLVESLHWLSRHQNEDGGWGDATGAKSNIAATMLVRAAFRLTGVPAKYTGLTDRADEYITRTGNVAALKRRYGREKTMVVPILTNCALAGLVPWRQVPALPFEAACLPQTWHRLLRLPILSYTLPALVAIGQVKFFHDPPRNPLLRFIRRASLARSLSAVQRVQPASGGFLEATPLTAFVVMSLASMGLQDHPIVQRGVEFLFWSLRCDSSWPIDSNLATCNTTLAVNGMAARPCSPPRLAVSAAQESDHATKESWRVADSQNASDDETAILLRSEKQTGISYTNDSDWLNTSTLDWLLDTQHIELHSPSGAKPGGWGWSNLSGAVPNVANTAGAMLALANFRREAPNMRSERVDEAAQKGAAWLLDLQNRDGGWPRFTRGWGTLPFDCSGSDLTAHALRALAAWQEHWKAEQVDTPLEEATGIVEERISPAAVRGIEYLQSVQRKDGSFVSMWFGNEHQPDEANPVYGTSRVLLMCAELELLDTEMAWRAARWLVAAQHSQGGWGPPRLAAGTHGSSIYRPQPTRAELQVADLASVEETSVAVEALLPLAETNKVYFQAVQRGLGWLTTAIEEDRYRDPATIGFYFSKLWYHERLYPQVFAAGALSRAVRQFAPHRAAVAEVG